jgi:hypothetical protein
MSIDVQIHEFMATPETFYSFIFRYITGRLFSTLQAISQKVYTLYDIAQTAVAKKYTEI